MGDAGNSLSFLSCLKTEAQGRVSEAAAAAATDKADGGLF